MEFSEIVPPRNNGRETVPWKKREKKTRRDGRKKGKERRRKNAKSNNARWQRCLHGRNYFIRKINALWLLKSVSYDFFSRINRKPVRCYRDFRCRFMIRRRSSLFEDANTLVKILVLSICMRAFASLTTLSFRSPRKTCLWELSSSRKLVSEEFLINIYNHVTFLYNFNFKSLISLHFSHISTKNNFAEKSSSDRKCSAV